MSFLPILLQIVDDSLNLARGNLLNYTRALSIIQYLEKETHYIPWSAAFRNFDYILTRFKPDEVTVFQVKAVFMLFKEDTSMEIK